MAKIPKDLSDEELSAQIGSLQQEQNRRYEEKKRAKEAKRQAFLEALHKVLSNEDVNGLVPEHGRTSCSDANLANGWGSGNPPRCTRCALIEFIEEGPCVVEGNYTFVLQIETFT